MKKRKLEGKDIKLIVEFKTFYVALVFIGIILLLGYIFKKTTGGIFNGLGITFLTSSEISIISEVFMKMELIDFMTQKILNVMPEEIKNDVGIKKFRLDRKNIDFKDFWENANGIIKVIGVTKGEFSE